MFAGLRRFILHEAGGQKLLAEMLQIFQRQTVRPKTFFEFLLGLIVGVLPVHEIQKEVFLLFEAIIAQADRILDDVIRAAFIYLRRHVQVAADTQSHLFATFKVALRGLRLAWIIPSDV